MYNSSYINTKVEQALACLDDLQRADPGPFFYQKVITRLSLKQNNRWDEFALWLSKPAIAGIFIGFIILVDASFFYRNTPVTNNVSSTIDSNGRYDDIHETNYLVLLDP